MEDDDSEETLLDASKLELSQFASICEEREEQWELNTPSNNCTQSYNNHKNIICFNGTGILLLHSVKQLISLEKQDRNWREKVHSFCGSSMGALVAGMLVCGYPPEQILHELKRFLLIV